MKNIELITQLLSLPMDAEVYFHARANFIGKHLDAPTGVAHSLEKDTDRPLIHIWGQSLIMKSPLPRPRMSLPPSEWNPPSPPASPRAKTVRSVQDVREKTPEPKAPEVDWPEPTSTKRSGTKGDPFPVKARPKPKRQSPK